jgi:hypothetical protein
MGRNVNRRCTFWSFSTKQIAIAFLCTDAGLFVVLPVSSLAITVAVAGIGATRTFHAANIVAVRSGAIL